MFREQKIATYTEPKKRIQLLQITTKKPPVVNGIELLEGITEWHIRINRKIVYKTKYRSNASKKFASIVTSEILQQKFSF